MTSINKTSVTILTFLNDAPVLCGDDITKFDMVIISDVQLTATTNTRLPSVRVEQFL